LSVYFIRLIVLTGQYVVEIGLGHDMDSRRRNAYRKEAVYVSRREQGSCKPL
jgi:hypothetical protein